MCPARGFLELSSLYSRFIDRHQALGRSAAGHTKAALSLSIQRMSKRDSGPDTEVSQGRDRLPIKYSIHVDGRTSAHDHARATHRGPQEAPPKRSKMTEDTVMANGVDAVPEIDEDLHSRQVGCAIVLGRSRARL